LHLAASLIPFYGFNLCEIRWELFSLSSAMMMVPFVDIKSMTKSYEDRENLMSSCFSLSAMSEHELIQFFVLSSRLFFVTLVEDIIQRLLTESGCCFSFIFRKQQSELEIYIFITACKGVAVYCNCNLAILPFLNEKML